jgi:hypothetical protein
MKITANIIRDAVKNEDAWTCGKIAEALRLDYGFNYGRIWRLVSNATGINAADWDALLYESEE